MRPHMQRRWQQVPYHPSLTLGWGGGHFAAAVVTAAAATALTAAAATASASFTASVQAYNNACSLRTSLVGLTCLSHNATC
jgi:hypothetical protein